MCVFSLFILTYLEDHRKKAVLHPTDRTAKGKMVIPAQFERLREFSSGLAAAYEKGQWGFLNRKGQWVIAPQYEQVWSFEGLATTVEILRGKKRVQVNIDKKGQIFSS